MERRLGRIQARHAQVNDLFEVTLREIANFSLTIVARCFPLFACSPTGSRTCSGCWAEIASSIKHSWLNGKTTSCPMSKRR